VVVELLLGDMEAGWIGVAEERVVGWLWNLFEIPLECSWYLDGSYARTNHSRIRKRCAILQYVIWIGIGRCLDG
jgi:hypothetical protein